MKIKIVYLLVCVTFTVCAMQEPVTNRSKVVTVYNQMSTTSLPRLKTIYTSRVTNPAAYIPRDLQLMLFELASQDKTVEEGIANMRALAYTCKNYWHSFCDVKMNGRVILSLEPQLAEELKKSPPSQTSVYWRLFVLVRRLKNRGATQWFMAQSIRNAGITKISELSENQRASLQQAFIKVAGGLTVVESRFLDRQPLYVLDQEEQPANGMLARAPIKYYH